MNATAPGLVNPATVRAHIGLVHDHVARALNGADRPGVLQLVRIHPTGGPAVSTRFAVGDVDRMVEAAIDDAGAGFNVYIETRTVAEGTSRRGEATDTRGVFAFVADSDGDKGRPATLPIEPSIIVETSPGNYHPWIFLDRALTAAEAEPLGKAIRAGTGGDSNTGVITQPYRVAGTPNYPGSNKIKRGRTVEPTRIIKVGGPIYTVEQLKAAFPPVVESERKRAPSGRTGVQSDEVEALAGEQSEKRGLQLWHVVKAARAAGMTPDDLEDVLRRHQNGCASKFLKPYDRLRREIDRAWDEAETRATRPAVDPTYPDNSKPVAEARQEVEAAIRRHLDGGYHAIRVATGTGKTQAAANAIAEEVKRLRAIGDERPFLYAVSTHRLGHEFEAQLSVHGISARVFRGRDAQDPERPGETMCDDLPAVKIAIDLGATVATACCKGKRNRQTVKCPFSETCSYQRQTKDRPDVWIVPHQLLFHAQAALGEVAGVFIDESFWQAGLWSAKRGLTIDEIEAPIPLGKARLDEVVADIEPLRQKLARGLRRQQGLGGVERRHLVAEGLTADDCTTAIKLEWQLKGETPLWPGMPPEARRKAAEAARQPKHVRSFARIWTAARDLRNAEIGAVSGRLFLAEVESDHGVSRVVRTRGIRSIAKQWAEAPTFVMDAILPDISVLKVFYPKIEVVADIDATMPHVIVRQVLGAPVSANKLVRNRTDNGNRALWSIRRAILHRHLELGRKPTLVVAQKAVAEWLKASGMPPAISAEHFIAIAGLDGYKEVRLLITVGRTLPNVLEVEAYAGAITGTEPVKTAQPEKGPRWFDRITRGIRLKDGTGYAVEGDHHPDPMAEAIRWQICEGELVQAIGRARGVNRTAATPLSIDIMADVVLPITIDEVVPWAKVPAGAEVEMLVEGVWLGSPSDMAKAWPKVWPTEDAAKQWRARCQRPIENILYRRLAPRSGWYRHPGTGQKQRTFRYSPDVCPDPAAWLEARLGPLAGCEVEPPHVGILDTLFDQAVAVRREPTPASNSMACFETRQGEPAPCHRGHIRLCGLEISL